MKSLTRRRFLKCSLAGGAAAALAPYSRVLGANDDIRVAVVGFRSQGSNHIKWFGNIPGVRVVAICDADKSLIDREVGKFKERNEKVDTYVDVRNSKNATKRSIPTSMFASCWKTKISTRLLPPRRITGIRW